MRNELDVDSRLAWDKFSLLTKKILPSGGSLVYESSFQRNDDIRITLEKLFIQDEISSAYLPDEGCISELVSDFRSQKASSQYLAKLSEKNSSSRALSVWEECLRQKEERESAELNAAGVFMNFDNEFVAKFEMACTSRTSVARLQEFYHVLGLNDAAFMQAFTVEEQNDSNIHAAEITKACREGVDQHHINDMIARHFEKTEAKKKHFSKKFRERLEINRKDFVNLVEKLYLEDSEKASSGGEGLLASRGSVRGDSLSEKISKKSQETEESHREKSGLLQMSGSKTAEKKERTSEASFKIELCLGSQKKYSYKVKILQVDLAKYILSRENAYRGGLFQRDKETENCIYGVNQKALVSVCFFDESGNVNLDSKLTNCLKFNSDLHFHSYSTQIKGTLKMASASKKAPELQLLNNGDVIITRHSNLGDLRIVFTFAFKNIIALQTEPGWEFMRRVFVLANRMSIKTLVFSLENFLQSSCNLKQHLEMLGKLLRMIRTELTSLSYEYPLNQNLRKILILLPQNIDSPQASYEKSKEVFKNCFE